MNIARYYDPLTTWSQCGIVNIALQRSDCCFEPSASDPAACNQDGYLERALKITHSYGSMSRRALTFTEIQSELNYDQPVGCRVAWVGGGAHFLAVKGWIVGASGTEYIVISDPIYLSTRVELSQFGAYQGGADWTHSYLTRSGAASGGSVAQSGATHDMSISHPEALGA